jgi:hypothetical protein
MSDKSKSKSNTTSTRIRDNQRRSRAQRKEFLDSLQQRVHEYERRGIAVTVEVQQAAKAVARENAALRRVLARHGVSRDEIEREVQTINGGPDVAGSWNVMRLDAALGPQSLPDQANRTTGPISVLGNSSKQVQKNCEVVGLQLQGALDSGDTAPATVIRPNAPTNSDNTSSAETSCIAAATIIAQMRGDGDDDFARTMLLGCHGTSDCRVKNTTVFRVLDEV